DRGTGALRAYDEVTLGGLGQTEVTIQRVVVPPAGDTAGSTGAPGDGAPASPTG
ncbi:MAG: metallophosphoesterase, partial [Geodermatophilales bacterium]|nr:metallophosphoesterase [Geodermatophilales bacterium]